MWVDVWRRMTVSSFLLQISEESKKLDDAADSFQPQVVNQVKEVDATGSWKSQMCCFVLDFM